MSPPSLTSDYVRPAAEWSLSVLVVDDHHDAADSLALLLRLWGHEVCVVYDSPSALQVVQEHPPDLLLLDLGMPGLDGFGLARRVRQLPELQACILVAVTGYADAAHQLECQEAGFDFFLAKPTEPEVLERLLRLVAKGKRIPDQAVETTLRGSDTIKIASSPEPTTS